MMKAHSEVTSQTGRWCADLSPPVSEMRSEFGEPLAMWYITLLMVIAFHQIRVKFQTKRDSLT